MIAKTNILSLFPPGLGERSYGPRLEMLHVREFEPVERYEQFDRIIRSALGSRFLPVYRMADGEFILMFGFRWNWRHKNPWWSLASYLKYQSIWYFGRGFKTSWGETYSRKEIAEIREFYREGIAEILADGMVCPFLY